MQTPLCHCQDQTRSLGLGETEWGCLALDDHANGTSIEVIINSGNGDGALKVELFSWCSSY